MGVIATLPVLPGAAVNFLGSKGQFGDPKAAFH
jgi:hypothetical protein